MTRKQKPLLHNDWIPGDAKQIIRRLQEAGHATYLVGGCVRDLLAGIHPKDFDIATDARPQQIKRLVRRSYIIGKRFRLVLVQRDSHQFEVATFRRNATEEEIEASDGFGDNFFGTPREDACRRDFTINGLLYDPVADKLIDYPQGLPDIEFHMLRMIGDPDLRLIEDPIRILRALRLAHKLNYTIDRPLWKAMRDNSKTLLNTALPRRREELLKILRLPEPDRALLECYDLDLLRAMVPSLHKILSDQESCDCFTRYLARTGEFVHDLSDPGDIFAFVVFALMQLKEDDSGTNDKVSSQQDDELSPLEGWPYKRMLKEELGMFNAEVQLAESILTILPRLASTKKYLKKGWRRRKSFLSQNGFALALHFAATDYLLSSEQILFWHKELEALKKDTHSIKASPQNRDSGQARRKKTKSTASAN